MSKEFVQITHDNRPLFDVDELRRRGLQTVFKRDLETPVLCAITHEIHNFMQSLSIDALMELMGECEQALMDRTDLKEDDNVYNMGSIFKNLLHGEIRQRAFAALENRNFERKDSEARHE